MQATEYCENCGAALHGPFCSHCGQHAKTPIVSFREFAGDALNNLFSVDSRVWRTVLPLFFRPGALTCDYIAGRRGRYLPPFRTYLVLSLLFFIIAAVFGVGVDITVNNELPLADVESSGIETNNSDESDDASCKDIQIGGVGFLDGPELEARVRGACEKVMADSGNSLFQALADNIPMMMFLFIPFVALLMKILYLFSHRKYIEHLLFLFHYHAFFFMILTVIVIEAPLTRSFPAIAAPAMVVATLGRVYAPVYLLIAMRRVYGQSWFLTSTKYFLLLAGYAVTLAVAFASTAIYTALTL